MEKNPGFTRFSRSKFRMVFRFVFSMALAGFAVFLSAGTADYWQGWIYLAILTYFSLFTMVILPPGLAAERMNPGKGVKSWDYLFMAVYFPMSFVVPAFCAADARRFGLSPSMPVWANIAGSLFIFLGSTLTIRSTWVNRFFSSMVRIQKDRGQTVTRTGPYAVVRHPGYSGGIVFYLFLPLAMNSLAGYFGSLVMIVALVVRTWLEDETLRKELEGYEEYTHAVRRRLVPMVW